GSNAAVMGVVVGGLVLVASAVRHRVPGRGRLVVAGVLSCLLAVVVADVAVSPPQLNQSTVNRVADSQRNGPLASDLGRLTTSVNARRVLWSDAVHGGLSHSVIGIGDGEAGTIVVNGQPL